MEDSGVKSDSSSSGVSPGELPGKPAGSLIHSAIVAAFGLAGAFAAWKLMAVIGPVFALPPDLAGLAFGAAPPPEVAARLVAETFLMNLKNAAVWMSVSGAVLGTLLGVALFAVQRPRHSLVRLIPATLIGGAFFGALAGCVAIYSDSFARMKMDPGAISPPEHFVLLTHSLTWLTAGLGIGLGLALGTRKRPGKIVESAVVVALAAMIGGCLYPIVAGILFPAVNSAFPVPHPDPTAARIIWLSLPAALMGLAAGRGR